MNFNLEVNCCSVTTIMVDAINSHNILDLQHYDQQPVSTDLFSS